jgi:hypothetical protein
VHRDRKLARKQALEMANAMAVSPGNARFVTVEKPQEKGPEPLTLARAWRGLSSPLKGLYPGPTKRAKQARTYTDAAEGGPVRG